MWHPGSDGPDFGRARNTGGTHSLRRALYSGATVSNASIASISRYDGTDNFMAQITISSETETLLARESSRILTSRLLATEPLQLRFAGVSGDETIQVPAAAIRMLVRILEEMGKGNAMTLIPVNAELTTQEAADLLNISRPSLIDLLDQGRIEFRKVGTHRRVRLESVLSFKRRADSERDVALAELAAYDQELKL